jgi:hypothetical protein
VIHLVRVGLLVAPLLLCGCGDEELELFVDLRTDLSPGSEFDNAVVELRDARGRLGEIVRSTESAAIASHDYTSGRRVAELVGLAAGDYVLRVELQLAGASVVEVLVPIALSADRAETVRVTRACADITCPRAGGDPTAVGCLEGRCVDPACLLGRGSDCSPSLDGGSMDASADAMGGDAGADADTSVPDTSPDAFDASDAPDAPDADPSCPSPGDYRSGTDHCTSPTDMTATMREDYGTAMDQTLDDVTIRCATGCLADPAPVSCTTACIVTDTDGGVSEPCAACYAGSAECVLDLCLSTCLAGPDDPSCTSCQAGTNRCGFSCRMELETCTGLTAP